jgi:hypothetical protein
MDKNYGLKHIKITELINNENFLFKFTEELKNYIFKTSANNIDGYRALKKLYNESIFNYGDFLKKYSYNGHVKIWKKTRFGWEEKLVGYMRGTAFRDKKRPDHAKHMKIKIKGIDRGDNFRKIKSEQNKHINFKKMFLINKNISIDGLSDEEVYKLYSNYQSIYRKSCEYKINKINNFLKNKKYINNPLYKDFYEKYYNTEITCDNHTNPFVKMMSIISHTSMLNNSNMGKTKFFKNGFITVKNCLNKKIIRYRSSWEEDTIKYLETTDVKYEYEPFYIELPNGKTYLPDFLIYMNHEKILLEIKGFIRGKIGKDGENIKIETTKTYCKNLGIRYVYLTKSLKNLKELKK